MCLSADQWIYLVHKKEKMQCYLGSEERFPFISSLSAVSIPVRERSIIRPPLLSSGQSSWLQIQKPGFDSRRYQIF
jgi:hypothetical protein